MLADTWARYPPKNQGGLPQGGDQAKPHPQKKFKCMMCPKVTEPQTKEWDPLRDTTQESPEVHRIPRTWPQTIRDGPQGVSRSDPKAKCGILHTNVEPADLEVSKTVLTLAKAQTT